MTVHEALEKQLASLLEHQRKSAEILSQICAAMDKVLEKKGIISIEEVREAYRAVERAAGGMEQLVELATQDDGIDPDLVAEALSLNAEFAEAAEKIAFTLSALREAEAERFNS